MQDLAVSTRVRTECRPLDTFMPWIAEHFSHTCVIFEVLEGVPVPSLSYKLLNMLSHFLGSMISPPMSEPEGVFVGILSIVTP